MTKSVPTVSPQDVMNYAVARGGRVVEGSSKAVETHGQAAQRQMLFETETGFWLFVQDVIQHVSAQS